MTMYSLIEDAQKKALDAANCWHETPEARELLAKIDAFERERDRWCAECEEAAKAFSDAADEARWTLDDMRGDAITAAADSYAANASHASDEWLEAWVACDEDAPGVGQLIRDARRVHAGDDYLGRLAA